MTLTERLREFLKIDVKRFNRNEELHWCDSVNGDGGAVSFAKGAKEENARLGPVHYALVECVERLRMVDHVGIAWPYDQYVKEALAKLDAALTEGEK